MAYAGLSPRVRGNLRPALPGQFPERSIPACAGEPSVAQADRHPVWVYPRVCGGTIASFSNRLTHSGLSPRVRGNRPGPRQRTRRRGSIPACAGEPPERRRTPSLRRVYPRVCGGTRSTRSEQPRVSGLSPRVRGNLGRHRPERHLPRSIPACAGEPQATPATASPSPVYPRVCGGTGRHDAAVNLLVGLSPRVRGNPTCSLADATKLRSIPACAGEPATVACTVQTGTVYPRVCGGTMGGWEGGGVGWGLSPRVRGNLLQLLCLPPLP